MGESVGLKRVCLTPKTLKAKKVIIKLSKWSQFTKNIDFDYE